MSSNLPPGVTEGDIPGNRPEDQEFELLVSFAVGGYQDMRRFVDEQRKLPRSKQHCMFIEIENIVEQIEDQFETEDQ